MEIDCETNMVDLLYDRKMVCIQFGSICGTTQYVIDLVDADEIILGAVRWALLQKKFRKIAHNAIFESTVIKTYLGIITEGWVDTMLMSLINENHKEIEPGYHSLAGCVERLCNRVMSKEEQTTFKYESETLITYSQIVYAATDVVVMYPVFKALLPEIRKWKQENTFKLENELIPARTTMFCENFILDKKAWLELEDEHRILADEGKTTVLNWLKENKREELIDLGFLNPIEERNFKWGITQKSQLMKMIYPELRDKERLVKSDYESLFLSLWDNIMPDKLRGKIPEEVYNEIIEIEIPTKIGKGYFNKIKRILLKSELGELCEFHEEQHMFKGGEHIQSFINRDYEPIEEYLVENHREELIGLGIIVPENTITLSLTSPLQRLEAFKLVVPSLESTGNDALKKYSHLPLFKSFKQFSKFNKRVTSYGSNFFKNVDARGMVCVNHSNQILVTGRTSIGLYQQMPGIDKLRNCFFPKTGYSAIFADYSSQEGFIAAVICQEISMIESFEKGYDFHGRNAALIFPDEWRAAGGVEKPTPPQAKATPELKELRAMAKKVGFSLFYGKTAVGLGEDMDIPGTVQDLMLTNYVEVDSYINLHKDRFNIYLATYYKKRNSLRARLEFAREAYEKGDLFPGVKTASGLITRFYEVFPNVKKVLVGEAERAAEVGYIQIKSPIGRVRKFKPATTNGEKNAIVRQASNTPIQGLAGDMTKYAEVQAWRHIRKNGLDKVVMQYIPIHDELVYIARDDHAEAWTPKLVKIMEDAAELMLKPGLTKLYDDTGYAPSVRIGRSECDGPQPCWGK